MFVFGFFFLQCDSDSDMDDGFDDMEYNGQSVFRWAHSHTPYNNGEKAREWKG